MLWTAERFAKLRKQLEYEREERHSLERAVWEHHELVMLIASTLGLTVQRTDPKCVDTTPWKVTKS
jgi:hypothetical protein